MTHYLKLINDDVSENARMQKKTHDFGGKIPIMKSHTLIKKADHLLANQSKSHVVRPLMQNLSTTTFTYTLKITKHPINRRILPLSTSESSVDVEIDNQEAFFCNQGKQGGSLPANGPFLTNEH